MEWSEIAALHARGVQIGSHSVTHRDLGRLPMGEVERELLASRRRIAEQCGFEVDEFAIPFGQSGNWPVGATEAAYAAGYRYVFAQSEDRRPPGTIPRTFVTRFDGPRVFRALLDGAFDRWEEWC
jgi:peptidoglycan/xylan/chitin deacetylase (PgdA/CDA1 family)